MKNFAYLQDNGWKKSFLGKDEGLSFFPPSTPQKFACGFCLSGKASFVVYETLASLFQFLFCSITIQFATTRRHARKWLFMSFSRQFSRKKPGEKESPWKKESWSFDSRGKTLIFPDECWSRLSIRMNKSQRISRGLHWRERRFCCQTTHKRGDQAQVYPRLLLPFFYFVAVSKMYSICPFLGNPYGFGICMNAILQMHISRVSTHKIWSSSGGPKRLLLQILCWSIVSLDYPISFGLVIIQG